METMWLTGKPSVAWYCVGKMFLTFWHLSKDSSTGHKWISIFENHKKDFCLLISYLFFLYISISVVVPSGNSSICLGVEHCISKFHGVEEFDTRNGLNPCRQYEVIFTWFTRYSSHQFANCIEFISQTSSVSPAYSARWIPFWGTAKPLLCFIELVEIQQQNHCLESWSTC